VKVEVAGGKVGMTFVTFGRAGHICREGNGMRHPEEDMDLTRFDKILGTNLFDKFCAAMPIHISQQISGSWCNRRWLGRSYLSE
jgi:hypothetical protein